VRHLHGFKMNLETELTQFGCDVFDCGFRLQ
jgi:hypothetical protein